MATNAAKRYAEAVFGLARENGSFEAWQRDLDRLAELMENPQARTLLADPNVAQTRKSSLIEAVQEGAQPEAKNLAKLLLTRNRMGIAPQMAELFREQALAELGIVVADVTTAIALGKEGDAAIKQRLTQMMGKQVEIRTHVDPEIIGGMVARIGDQLIDGSVAGQLRRLRERMVAPA